MTVSIALLLFGGSVSAREITLFDRTGTPVAYVDTDQEFTVFLWNGTPVAYLSHASIFGFDGKHLGWLRKGIVRDHDGNGVGFVEGAVNMLTKLEPLKGLEKLTPLRSLEELEPMEPMTQDAWSNTPLELFLEGAE